MSKLIRDTDKVYEVESDGDGIYSIVLVERKTTEYAWSLTRAAADKVAKALNEADGL